MTGTHGPTKPDLEAMFPDGSLAQFFAGGGSVHDGPIAIERLRLITAKSALSVWVRQADQGIPARERFQLTRNGHRLAILNVIEPLAGKMFASPTGRCSDKACREALAACVAMLAALEDSAVILSD